MKLLAKMRLLQNIGKHGEEVLKLKIEEFIKANLCERFLIE